VITLLTQISITFVRGLPVSHPRQLLRPPKENWIFDLPDHPSRNCSSSLFRPWQPLYVHAPSSQEVGSGRKSEPAWSSTPEIVGSCPDWARWDRAPRPGALATDRSSAVRLGGFLKGYLRGAGRGSLTPRARELVPPDGTACEARPLWTPLGLNRKHRRDSRLAARDTHQYVRRACFSGRVPRIPCPKPVGNAVSVVTLRSPGGSGPGGMVARQQIG